MRCTLVRRTSAVSLSLLALLVGVVGCGGPAGADDIPGRWELRTINGDAMPAPVSVGDGAAALEVVIDQAYFDFADDGTCAWTTVRNGARVCNTDCTWELVAGEADPLRVLIGDAPSLGSASRKRMRLEGQWGNVLVFRAAGAVPADEPADTLQAPCPFLRCGVNGPPDSTAAPSQ